MGRVFACSLVGLLLGVAACGEDEAPFVGGSSGSDGGGGTSTAGDSSVPDAAPSLGPRLTLLEPFTTEVLGRFDVEADALLVEPRVDVRCRVEANQATGEAVDPGSVKVIVASQVEDDPPEPIEVSADPLGDDVFGATVNVEGLPAGPVQIECSANDRGMPTQSNVTAGYTYVDHGPRITAIKPAEGSAFAGSDEFDAEFVVEPVRLRDDDGAAGEIEASFYINGQEVAPGQVAHEGDAYSFLLDFDDTAYFTQGLTTASIEVKAINGRSPTPARSELRVTFSVDDEGPRIRFTNRDDGEIVAGEAPVRVEVTDDDSGVDPTSVRITIASDAPVTMEPAGSSAYTHTFASRTYDPAPLVTVEVTAEDRVGNTNSEDILLYLDNVKPWVSMDPPTMRAVDNTDDDYVCSSEFDPLGGMVYDGEENLTRYDFAAADDLDTVGEFVPLRAFIYDRTNVAPAATSVFAGVDDRTPEIWLQRDPNVPLLIDTNGDGYCDDINSSPGAGERQPASFNLSAISTAPLSAMPRNRDADFETDPTLETSMLGAPSVAGCAPDGSAEGFAQKPTGQCDEAPMFTLKHGGIITRWVPVIYAFNPSSRDSMLHCRGQTVPMQISEPEFSDWVCVATRAVDGAGNRSISAPLRLCVDKKNGGTHCETTAPPPSCLGDCVLEPTGALGDGGPKDIPSDVPRVVVYN